MNNSYQKWLAGEGCCGAHNFIHIEIPDCDKHDVCDCENILLEISKLHTDDEILQEEIDELSGKVETISGEVDNKLDITAYTPVDLTDYATKEWVEDKGYLTTHQTLKTINGESLIGEGNIVISGGSGATIDAYTKQESDNRFQPKGNYLTSHQPIKTINNQSLIGTGNITISGDTDLSNYYTKAEVNYLIPTVPTNVSAFNNDAGYLTQHQPLKTINGQTISGTGNIVIEASGTSVTVDNSLSLTSTNPVQNKVITEALNGKLDATAYTPTEQVQANWNETNTSSKAYIKNKPTIPTVPTNISAFNNDANYVTSGNVVTRVSGNTTQTTSAFPIKINVKFDKGNSSESIAIANLNENDFTLSSSTISISGNYAKKSDIPTSNSAFTNDEHYITSADTVFNNYATTANTYTKTEVNNLLSNKIWCGTQAQYDALSTKENDVLYLIHE